MGVILGDAGDRQMAMIAFYAGLIVGIFIGCVLMSLFCFFLAGNDTGLSGPPKVYRQGKPLEL
jgi:hypothetical protein